MKHEDFTLLPQAIDEDVSCKEIDYDQCMYKVSTHRFFLNLIISTHRCYGSKRLFILASKLFLGTGNLHARVTRLCCTLDHEQ